MEWEKVLQNKEIILQVEEIVDKVADIYYDFPQEICSKLNELTGNNWTGDEYLQYCAGFWESPWNLEEVVFALFHEGQFPDKKEEGLYAWSTGQSIENDEEVISFFRFGKYINEKKTCSKYEDIAIEQLYSELLGAFSKWNNDANSWEEDEYKTFWCSNTETYGYEKEIHIYSGYDRKFLNCTLINLNEQEKNIFVNIIQKYCNHVATDADNINECD